MQIRTYSSIDDRNPFGERRWDLAIVGDPVDERGQAAVDHAASASSVQYHCEYRLNSKAIFLDGKRAPMPELIAQLGAKRSILIEATTLGLIEILIIVRAAYKAGVRQFDVLYVEPIEYQRTNSVDAPWLREFSLSSNRRFEGVHGFVVEINAVPEGKGRMVALLGYEGARLSQACEQLPDLSAWTKYAVFGIPSYSPGWELNAFANNAPILEREGFSSVRFCSASSVSLAYKLLEDIHKECGEDGTTVIAPLGTKPHGIASALFLNEYCEYQQSALIYDHPTRIKHRSRNVRRWHLYQIKPGQ